MDQVTSKLETLFDEIDELKPDTLHLNEENKINTNAIASISFENKLNNNAIASIKVDMNTVNDKFIDQKKEAQYQAKHINSLRSSQHRYSDNITKLLKKVTTHSLKLNLSGPNQVISLWAFHDVDT